VGSGFQYPSFETASLGEWEPSQPAMSTDSVVRSHFPNLGLVKQMRGEKNMPTRWEQARDSRVGWVWIFVLNFNVWGGTNTNGAGVSSTILYSFEPYFWIKIRYWVILFFKGLKPQLPAGTKQLNLLLAPKAVGPPSVMLEDRLRRVEIQSFWIFWGQKQWIFSTNDRQLPTTSYFVVKRRVNGKPSLGF
jgi:hypothetical protein